MNTLGSRKSLRVLVGADGSAQARSAIAGAIAFPWPEETQVRAVVAQQLEPVFRPTFAAALQSSAKLIAEDAKRALSNRWPEASAVVVDESPAEGVLAESKRFRADVILMGWRGEGPARRLLMGSVSRNVVRRATCSVLVVRGKLLRVPEIVIGFDGSAQAQRAVQLVQRFLLNGARITIFRAADRIGVPSQALAPARTMAMVREEVRRINAESLARARKEVDSVAASLKDIGWRVRTVVTTGAPLHDLLSTVDAVQADLLVVGARGTSGIRHLLLGSVADGALNQCPVSVLIAR